MSEWLRDVVIGAALQTPDLFGFEAASGENDNRYVADVAYAFEHLPTVDPGKTDIEHDEIRAVLMHHAQSDLSVGGVLRGVAGPIQPQAHEVSDVRVVFDDQNPPVAHRVHVALLKSRHLAILRCARQTTQMVGLVVILRNTFLATTALPAASVGGEPIAIRLQFGSDRSKGSDSPSKVLCGDVGTRCAFPAPSPPHR